MAAQYTTYIGFGSDFMRSTDGGVTYTTVGNTPELAAPDRKAKDVDVSYAQMPSADRLFQAGLRDNGESTFKLLMNKTQQAVIEGDFTPPGGGPSVTRYWKIVFPDLGATASTIVFQGYINGLSEPIPLDEDIVIDVKIKISGKVVFTPGT